MRTLMYAINLTADGCCDHAKVGGTEEMLQHYTELLGGCDLQVFGRKTYELMVPYWPDVAKNPAEPKAAIDFANVFCALDRVVFSRSLQNVEEKKTNIVRSNLKDEILQLKQQPGKKILTGGVSVPQQLIELGLVDEFHFVITPSIAGDGRRLSEGMSLPEKLQLKLVESRVFPSGAVALHYRKQ